MKKLRVWNLIGMAAILMLLQLSVYGCGGRDSHSGDLSEPFPANYVDSTTGMEFVLIPGGCFQMGDHFGDGIMLEGVKIEEPVHEVCLDPFYMGKYPVTQEQWEGLMESNPSYHTACNDCPVEQVSWTDVQAYLEKLNAAGDKMYRLPTEAEWEYAAKSGEKQQKYPGTSDPHKLIEYAWYKENLDTEEKTHPVGGKKPNSFDLYDMGGNVLEWVGDWYGLYTPEFQENPKGPESGTERVIRSSSYRCMLPFARASMRDFSQFEEYEKFGNNGPDDFKLANLGFRIAFPAVSEE